MNTNTENSTFTAEELEKAGEAMWKTAEEQAAEHLKKNRKEIDRLMVHAEYAIANRSFDQYYYAITKLKVLYKQPPMTREQIKHLYDTTIASVENIIKTAGK